MDIDPCSIGLPDKFKTWRPDQWDAIERAANSDQPYIFVCAPTGFGKSPAYMANGLLAASEGKRTVILTSTKGLQEQLIQDFSTISDDVRGKNAYVCLRRPEVSVDEGLCHIGYRCDLKDNGCLYYDAVRQARSADIVVTNYAFWLAINYYGEGLGQVDQLILDEAHDAPEQLAGFLSVEWDRQDASVAGLEWREWDIGQWVEVARARLEMIQGRLREAIKNGGSDIWQYKKLKSAEGKLSRIAGMNTDQWMLRYERKYTGRGMSQRSYTVAKFDVLDPRMFGALLFRSASKVILYSATVRPKTAQLLGIPEDVYDFLEYDSTFPADRHPIIHVPTIRLRHSTSEGEIAQWRARIDQIISGRLDRKGVVHTVSYKRAKNIIANSQYADIMLFGEDARSTREAIKVFRECKGPRVLVSPSVTTGYDFPYDQCEYQIIGKIPFPDASDGVMKERAKRDQDLMSYIAAQNLVQMTGRGMRASDDRCEDLIIDDNIGWFTNKYRGFLPRWWMKQFRKVNTIPEPPPKL